MATDSTCTAVVAAVIAASTTHQRYRSANIMATSCVLSPISATKMTAKLKRKAASTRDSLVGDSGRPGRAGNCLRHRYVDHPIGATPLRSGKATLTTLVLAIMRTRNVNARNKFGQYGT